MRLREARGMAAYHARVEPIEQVVRRTPLYQRLPAPDLERVVRAATLRSYASGELIFLEGDESGHVYTIASGRVKIVKTTGSGRDVILEIFGPGDPIGAVATYEGRPYPASAAALEPSTCLLVGREALFELLETSPSFARGLLAGLTYRLAQLSARLAEVAGERVETRMARLFLKIAERMGRAEGAACFIPLPLSRQDLADLSGTTLETAIRVMSRWAKKGIVSTRSGGFLVVDCGELARLAFSGRRAARP